MADTKGLAVVDMALTPLTPLAMIDSMSNGIENAAVLMPMMLYEAQHNQAEHQLRLASGNTLELDGSLLVIGCLWAKEAPKQRKRKP